MQRGAFFCLWILFTFSLFAQNKENGSVACDSIVYKNTFGKALKKFLNFSDFDTTYISPNRYNYALMLDHFTNYEYYSVGNDDQRLRFSPNPHNKIGAYFGWRWIFLGWAVDTDWLYGKKSKKKRGTEFDLSLYSSKLGVDIFYRSTGNDYKIHKVSGFSDEIPSNYSEDFNGLKVKMKGLHFQQSTFLLSSRLQPVHQPALQCRFFHCRILRIHPQSELRLYQAARNHSGNHEPGYEGETYQIHEHQPQRRLCLQLGVCPQLPRMPVVQSGCRLQDITHREDRRAGSGRLVQEFQYRLHSACRCGIQQQQILRGYLIRRTDIRLLQKQFLPEQRVRHPPNICRIQLLSEKGVPEEQKVKKGFQPSSPLKSYKHTPPLLYPSAYPSPIACNRRCPPPSARTRAT